MHHFGTVGAASSKKVLVIRIFVLVMTRLVLLAGRILQLRLQPEVEDPCRPAADSPRMASRVHR